MQRTEPATNRPLTFSSQETISIVPFTANFIIMSAVVYFFYGQWPGMVHEFCTILVKFHCDGATVNGNNTTMPPGVILPSAIKKQIWHKDH